MQGLSTVRIEGGPGTGKTVLAAFLVDQLESATRNTPGMTFAYFFLRQQRRKFENSATSILRSLLSQLLRQTRLFQACRRRFQAEKRFSHQFWSTLEDFNQILRDSRSGNVFLLMTPRWMRWGITENLLNAIKSSFKSSDIPMRLKIVITCRREDDIQAKLKQCSTSLAVDRGKTNADLSRFISNKSREISTDMSGQTTCKTMFKTSLLKSWRLHSYGRLLFSKNSKKHQRTC